MIIFFNILILASFLQLAAQSTFNCWICFSIYVEQQWNFFSETRLDLSLLFSFKKKKKKKNK